MDDDFEARNRAQWAAAIRRTFGAAPPRSETWTDLGAMLRALAPLTGPGLNHTMLPGGGGYDMVAAARSPEPGCLEFSQGGRLADTCRPAALRFGHFPRSPWNSFFLLETRPLEPCGAYGETGGGDEEVVEVSPGRYAHPSHRETGVLGHDADGREIPLPATSRLVVRHLRGKFLVVAKASIWNLTAATYDGRHSRMTAEQVRAMIQHALDGTYVLEPATWTDG
jgi:hypothetical protein